jgi:peptide/nickel transport system ATP-binding protein
MKNDTDMLLRIKDLAISYKVYGGKLNVINGVNMDLPRGKAVGLVGESGCGKTTILKSLLRILPSAGIIERGEVLYQGQNIFDMHSQVLADFRRAGAGMIFQDPTAALNPVFSIGDQLLTALRYAHGSKISKKELSDKAVQSLLTVSMADPERIMNSYPFQLSGGMRQRVCIAMALAADKKILLADEPGTSLDVTIQDQILRLINQLVMEKNLAVILVSHSLGVIRAVAEYVYIMYAGTIVEQGGTRDVFNSPRHPYTVALLNCLPKLTGEGIASGIPGRIPDYLDPPAGCRYSPRCAQSAESCALQKPEMRQVAKDHLVACNFARCDYGG